MNKFTKISATALFALFLTACDKPADKAAEAPKAEATQTAQQAAPATQPAAQTVDAQGAEDFQKIVAWNQAQDQVLAASQAELQQKMATGDKAQIEGALKSFNTKVAEVVKSLDAVEVKDAAVAAFKAKTKETLTLSSDLIAESVKVMSNPSAEAQKLIQEKSQFLIKTGQELQQLQLQLQQKFMPAAPAAPAAK